MVKKSGLLVSFSYDKFDKLTIYRSKFRLIHLNAFQSSQKLLKQSTVLLQGVTPGRGPGAPRACLG